MSNEQIPGSGQGDEPKHGEPEVDPDSPERLTEERPDAPHDATRFEAPAGHGTADGPPYGQEFQERPVLDGSTQSDEAEASVPNPHRGQADPATIARQPALNSTRSSRWLVASCVAAVILVLGLLLLARWEPVWCGVGVVVALVALVLMLVLRASRMEQRSKLRAAAVLMAVLWLVPLAVILSVLVGRREEIWPL